MTACDPGVAFAGRVAPVAAIPISAKAAAVRVIAQRTPEASPRLIRHSSRADPPNAILAFAVIDTSPGDRRILALRMGVKTAMRQLSNDIAA